MEELLLSVGTVVKVGGESKETSEMYIIIGYRVITLDSMKS